MLTLIALAAAAVAVAVVANWKLQFFRWDLMDEVKRLFASAQPVTAEPETSAMSEPDKIAEPVKTAEPVAEPAKLAEPAAEPVKPAVQPRRARDGKGKFVGDKPETTVVNEAWAGGQAPAKKTNSRRRRPSAKK